MVVLPSPKLVFFVCIGIFSVEVLGVDPRGYIIRYNWVGKERYFICGVAYMPSTGSPIQIEISKVSPGEPFIIEHQAGKYEFIALPDAKGLMIEELEKEDEGNYQCTVRAGDFQWTSKQFYVEYKAEASIEDIPRRHLLDLGQEFSLTCEASGYPVPTVYWGKEGSDFHSEGPILHFPSVTEEDSGQYFCIADNHGSKAARVDTKIGVPFFPAIVTAVNTTITTGRGWDKYVRLECVVDGLPVPLVRYWKLKNGVRERVPNDRRKYPYVSNYISDPSPNPYITTPKRHIMFIEELELTDSGTYFCTAENRLGRDEQEFTVLVLGVDPTGYFKGYMLHDKLAYIQCGVTDMPSTGSPIQIEISKVSPGEPFIIEHQAGKYEFITRPDQKDLLIEGMEKEDEGNYQCTVRAGDFQWTSKQIYVEYKVV